MPSLTLRVISGADRGQVYPELEPPITIGREEGNVVQLNDERISRYHVKIQEDDGRLVVTDLDSTNGTRVNGNVCSLKILRYGDTISIGRTVLLVGSQEQVSEIYREDGTTGGVDPSTSGSQDSHEIDPSTGLVPVSPQSSVHQVGVPHGLKPAQAAELRELLDHIHGGMRQIVEDAVVDEKKQQVTIDVRAWQKLLSTQSEVSQLIRAIEDPQTSDSANEL